ncbi:MAG: hypothetical protein H7039_20940 [Bryobacteraceae bacterium]|nr:hypothetical protein [Bryobacteraceae bacterium]
MSIYETRPICFDGLRTVPLGERGGKVAIAKLAKTYQAGDGVAGLLQSLPGLLAAEEFLYLTDRIVAARAAGKPVLWGLGGHVIKCGLAPVLADLMGRGFITGFLFNGSTAIHDFEIAIAGHTSEDVEAVLPDGAFGVSEETGREMNLAIRAALVDGIGFGEGLGRYLAGTPDLRFGDFSLLSRAYHSRVPVTVHVAIGTDTVHMHPDADGAALGETTHVDFRLACSLIAGLDNGGVYVNAGSAVILPEVFLKAVSVVRNLGGTLANFTTATLDFLQHYRPRMNVLQRPHFGSGGRGVALTGHHELMIPLLAAALIERQAAGD